MAEMPAPKSDESYSWMQFGIGVAAGAAAIALLLMEPEAFYVTALLMFLSVPLIVQAPESREPFVSDRDEWRQAVRRFVGGFPAAAVELAVALPFAFGIQLLIGRYASTADVPWHMVVAVVIAVFWIRVVLGALRNVRMRHGHATR